MDRRRFLVASAGAVFGVRRWQGAAGSGERGKKRVAVLGAGLAGLAAAWELEQAGHDVVVLEARMRPGGRVMTLRDGFAPGLSAEAGAMSFSDDYRHLLRYAELLGVRHEPLGTAAVGPRLPSKRSTPPGRPAREPRHPALRTVPREPDPSVKCGRYYGEAWRPGPGPAAASGANRPPACFSSSTGHALGTPMPAATEFAPSPARVSERAGANVERPEDLEWLRATLGERAQASPAVGALGNLHRKDIQEVVRIVEAVAEEVPSKP